MKQNESESLMKRFADRFREMMRIVDFGNETYFRTITARAISRTLARAKASFAANTSHK